MLNKFFVYVSIFLFAFSVIFSEDNSIVIGINKINNTYTTLGVLNYKVNTGFGDFEVFNNYSGTIITNVLSSFRDAEDFNFNYKYAIRDSVFLISETKYNLVSDRNNLLNNKLEKISEQIGLSTLLSDKLLVKAIYGLQYNKQSDLKANGSLINTALLLNKISLDGWNIVGYMDTEHLLLNDNRNSSDINVNGKLDKQFSQDEFFNLELKYKRRGRDFIQSINAAALDSIKSYATESNNENRIEGNIDSRFELFTGAFVKIEGSVGVVDVSRKYKEQISTISNSKIGKNYDEWTSSANVSVDYEHNSFFHNIGFRLDNRNEHYYLENVHNLELSDFNSGQLLESQKDNNTFTFKLFYNPIIAITKRDSLLVNIVLSKTEYNTPSTINKDERDIVNHIFSLEYRRQCSKILTITSKINYLQNHTVFIHKERSSQNNWNKVISYQNGIIINSGIFYYYPQFEVLANYTIYDFETFSNSIRSYSIRQLGYRDSLSIKIVNSAYLTNKNNFRYHEQSKLFWNTFSEQPQRQSIDVTSTWMCRYDFNNERENGLVDKKFGLGVRLYYLNVGVINATNNRNIIYSYSPEVLFIFRISKWEFNCNAWSEFRNENENKRIIPHFVISTGYKL